MVNAPKPPSPGYLEWLHPDDGWVGVEPSPNHLDLLPEQLPIELRICGIPEDLWGESIQIKVSNEDDWNRIFVVSGSGCAGPFTWPDPGNPDEYEICVTNVVQYRTIELVNGYDTGNVHVVDGIIGDDIGKPAHVHIIPEFAFGTAMAVLSLFSGLGIYSKYRRV